MPSWGMYTIIGCLLALTLWARSHAKEGSNNWATPLSAACGFLGLAAAIIQVILVFKAPESDGGISKRQQSYAAAMMRVVGEELGAHHRGAKVLLISAPETELNKPYHDLVRAQLDAGMDGRGSVGERVEFGADRGDEYSSNLVFTAADMDAIIAGQTGHTVVISLLGLPADFIQMDYWDLEEDIRPRLVLVDVGVYELRRAISADFISAVVTRNPSYKFDRREEIPAGHQEAFDRRYLLVTPRTVDEIADTHGGLFKPESQD
jgi:hypothetical protein